MQRRAAAAYTAIFVAIAAFGGYGIVTGRTFGLEQGEVKVWALALLGGIAAIILLSSAYMPVRGD